MWPLRHGTGGPVLDPSTVYIGVHNYRNINRTGLISQAYKIMAQHRSAFGQQSPPSTKTGTTRVLPRQQRTKHAYPICTPYLYTLFVLTTLRPGHTLRPPIGASMTLSSYLNTVVHQLAPLSESTRLLSARHFPFPYRCL